jgi:hypothetical protein
VAGALADLSQLHVVSEILGHASIVVTKDVYGHLIGGDKRSAAELVSEVLFGGWHLADGREWPVLASDLGALGGTRTPNLLIRRDLQAQPLSAHTR